MQFTRDIDNITINQYKYLDKIKIKFNKHNLTPVLTPVELGINLVKNENQASDEDIKIYQQQIGALLYLALKTRPDIAFAVNRCSRFMSNPDNMHFRALDRIWKYLNKYPYLNIKIIRNLNI